MIVMTIYPYPNTLFNQSSCDMTFTSVMLSYEVMHYLKGKKTGKDEFMALKLDMSKAYDRI